MKTKFFFLFVCCLLLLGSCKKDSLVTTITEDGPPVPVITIESEVRGLILGQNGEPLEGASVSWGNNQITTDENGLFIINDLVNGKEAVLKVEKEGYFDAFQTLLPIAETSLKTQVRMIPRLLSDSFESSQGEIVQIPDGIRIYFQANSFVNELGVPYNGTVNVYASYINPVQPFLDEIMPGNLQAVDAQGDFKTLQTFGMINVELETPTGAPLQIIKEANLRMPIPLSLMSQAPSTIPLWHFDKTTGLWVEEGEAELLGDEYVGQVSHFSFWNCDVPYDLVEVKGRFLAEKFEIEGKVRITATALNSEGSVRLSEDGSFRGKVIKATPLFLELIDPFCNEVIYSLELGPLGRDFDLGTVNIELDDTWVSVTGTLVDCDQQPVSNGVAVVKMGDRTISVAAEEDGSILTAFRSCGVSSLSIEGLDWDKQERGNPQSYTVSPEISAGNISACGTAFSAYVKFSYDGGEYIIDNCIATIEPADSLGSVYVFTATDDFGAAGKVIYTFNFLDWNLDPENPLWGANFNHEIIGGPGKILGFGGNTAEIVGLQTGTQPGELVVFRIENTRINDQVSGQEYEGGSVEIVAVLE